MDNNIALQKLKRLGLYLVLIVGAITMLAPFIWMVLASLKSNEEIFLPLSIKTLIPLHPHWENYSRLMVAIPFIWNFLNSVKVAVLAVTLALFSSSLTAFALARLEFPGRNFIFLIVLAVLMLPYQVTVIPVFKIFVALGWYDTDYPLWAPLFFGSAFGIFLLKQFFQQIPRSLDEAAMLDGCSPWGIYWRIYVPLAKPMLVTFGLFVFMWSWNDLWQPLIYISTLEKMTLPAALSFLQGGYSTEWGLLMAGALISILPILIAYLYAQRQFIDAAAGTGIKG